ncbi:hypothetical protein CPT03_21900 [Pedobacter ginsengisoli]|uniref:DUF4145 domain-containing protein n=1 Tax=Pedobacter ginsengisoli TaxID=363852 RepID=A0A2D1UBK5_9SPHI|nr:hypothetical protein [Pedobacter ginsengisoli]ATP58931.1 hypothetical protein CPT03_21900 [Pedobacter ginsengisoli]
MKIEDIKTRINDLITLAGNVLGTHHRSNDPHLVDTEAFAEFRTSSLSFLEKVFGKEHPFYRDFDQQVKDIDRYMTEQGRGILKGAKQEIDGGWLFTVKGLVSAEIFSDFLEMAEYLLQEGYKDPAAVMTGSVLEEYLRQLCRRDGIAVEVDKGGKLSPKKADLLNADLANAGVYNKLDQKTVTSWLDLRNKAAHGKYAEYTKEQVDFMYQGVTNFISRTTS